MLHFTKIECYGRKIKFNKTDLLLSSRLKVSVPICLYCLCEYLLAAISLTEVHFVVFSKQTSVPESNSLLTIVLYPSQTFHRFQRRAENKANAEMPQSCSFSNGPLRPPPILIQSP